MFLFCVMLCRDDVSCLFVFVLCGVGVYGMNVCGVCSMCVCGVCGVCLVVE